MNEPFINADGIPTWIKHPDDSGQYGLDFGRIFPVGDVIATSVWPAVAGLTLGAKTESGTTSSVVISGGTLGADYEVSCTATSSSGMVRTRSAVIAVRKR